MKTLQKSLSTPLGKTRLRVWHVLAAMALLWVVPLTFSDDMLFQYAPLIVAVWVVAYFVVNWLIKRAVRVARFDIILIERFFILLSPLFSAILATLVGLRSGFDTFTGVLCGMSWVISAALVLGIVLHIKNAKKYYHGVKKDDLFQ